MARRTGCQGTARGAVNDRCLRNIGFIVLVNAGGNDVCKIREAARAWAIKTINMRSRGFRNKEQCVNAIYVHPGRLNLYPEGIFR